MSSSSHPAPFSRELMPYFAQLLEGSSRIFDPFAGIGRIFELESLLPSTRIYANEIEPEWAHKHPHTKVGNALDLPAPSQTYDAICTSPCYGNRLADAHNPKDSSKRISYKFNLGRDPHPDSSATLQWGAAYRDFHRRAWAEIVRTLEYGGRFVLNCKDHIRNKRVMPVCGFHVESLQSLGLVLHNVVGVHTPALRYGANSAARAGDAELVFLFYRERHPQRG